MGWSLYVKNGIINHLLRGTALPSPTKVYMALFTSDPDASGTEVSGGGYTRMEVTFSAPVSGATSNTADVMFPIATANWGSVGWGAIFDAQTGGNMINSGAAIAAKDIKTDDQLIVRAGKFTVTQS